MIYIHSVGLLHLQEGDVLEIKPLLKAETQKVFRRTDRFIQLALLGASRAMKEQMLDEKTGLYMASGQGNLAVFNRLRDQQYIDHQPPKPVDFINSLSNTAGFYVAQYLGLFGKNLNLNQQGVVAYMTLLLAQNNLLVDQEKSVLVGGVDELLHPLVFTRKFLGLDSQQKMGEGSNWLLLKREKKGALASLEVDAHQYTLEHLLEKLVMLESEAIAFSPRLGLKERETLLKASTASSYEYEEAFYETLPLYVLASFVETQQGSLHYVEYFEGHYYLLKVVCLTHS